MNAVHQSNVKILNFILISLLLLGIALAESEPIELLHAGTMQKVTEDIEDVVDKAKGNYLMFDHEVHLKQGEVHLFADRIYQYEDIDLLRLFGNVKIFDDSVTIVFQEGDYNTDNKDLNVPSALNIQYDGREFSALSLNGNLDDDVYLAKGKVEIKDSISYAYADSMKFDRVNDRAWLYGEAMMSDTVNHITMRGAELEYRLDTDEFFGHKDASVYETLENGKKRFEIFAGKMKGNMKEAWLTATDSVYVQQDSSSAWCDSLFYNDTLQTVQFFGDAHLQYKDIDMFGPEMQLNFYREHLGNLTAPIEPRVTLKEEGFIGNEKDTLIEKISHMKGKYLYLEFNRDDEPEQMHITGMVTSDYHVFKDSVYKGMNHMTSDTVHILFEEGEVSDLFAIFGVEGRFDPDTSYEEMDTSVFYYGNEAHYSIKNDNMFIYPVSRMNYGNIKLKADTMKIDWQTNILYAMPGKSSELPEFIQNNDAPVYARLFEYNLDTQRGRITKGKTEIKEGYYQGKTILKTEDEPLYVKNGIFSTCDLDEPHFCIEAKRMKVIPGDRVFAQDLTLKVMDIPLLYIPSLFVSIEEGKRRSGWIIPGFGDYSSTGKGWALEGSGYYWAPNDYYDARILVDFYDNQGITAELRQRYAWKNHISGGRFTFKYWNNFLSNKPKQGYEISINHPQKIGRNSSLNINGSFTNDRTRYEDELDMDERLEQQMVSRATFQTKLGPFAMNINASHTEDLGTGSSTTYLPQFSISKPRATIFSRKSKTAPEKWYHKFTYNISSSMTNKLTHTWNNIDSLYSDTEKNKFQTIAGVQYNNKLFGFLTVSPYVNYYEDWTMLYMVPEMRNDSAVVDSNGKLQLLEVDGFKRRGRFNLGAFASTTLYGVFNLNLGPLKAVRHTMNMSLNYVYRPDQSNNPDYVFHGIGTDSSIVKYDYFSNTLLGATPSAESKTFNMNFNHNFDAKTVNKEGKEEKTTFLNLRHSYNFLADSLRSSVITARSTIRDLPGGMDLKIDATFDPYDYRENEDGSITRINQFTIPRMTKLRIGTGLLIKPRAKEKTPKEIVTLDTTENREVPKQTIGPAKGSDMGFSKWSINSGISFVSNASDPLDIKNSLLVTTTMKANLTPKWSGTYRINFDVLEQKITDQRISLTRDMHCWTFSLDWRPGNSIFVRLNAKSSLLKDFKMLQKKSYY
ncbi:MAG: putative LPS assembly protein LptD [Candidatus Marinimicrobia bacterium]|nr:putative LPS assembly protein LptD [Candidatus Neomarinimicrobiota bacterium]